MTIFRNAIARFQPYAGKFPSALFQQCRVANSQYFHGAITPSRRFRGKVFGRRFTTTGMTMASQKVNTQQPRIGYRDSNSTSLHAFSMIYQPTVPTYLPTYLPTYIPIHILRSLWCLGPHRSHLYV